MHYVFGQYLENLNIFEIAFLRIGPFLIENRIKLKNSPLNLFFQIHFSFLVHFFNGFSSGFNA